MLGSLSGRDYTSRRGSQHWESNVPRPPGYFTASTQASRNAWLSSLPPPKPIALKDVLKVIPEHALAPVLKFVDVPPLPEDRPEQGGPPVPLLVEDGSGAAPIGSSLQIIPRFNFDEARAAMKPEHAEVVNEAFKAADEIKQSAIKSTTAEEYARTISKYIPQIQTFFTASLLPMDALWKVVMVFTMLVEKQEIAPKSWTQRPDKPDGHLAIRWSVLSSLRAALLYYHKANGVSSALDKEDPEFGDFWRGLKTKAVHLVKSKTPTRYEWLDDMFLDWEKCCVQFRQFAGKVVTRKAPITSITHSLLNPDECLAVPQPPMVSIPGWFWNGPSEVNQLVALRRKALAAIGFLGVRRNAEIQALLIKHLIPASEAEGFWVYVACAKNDRYGTGNRTFIPRIVEAGHGDPYVIICTYLLAYAHWGEYMLDLDPDCLPAWRDRPLFSKLKGKDAGAPLADRSVREDIEAGLRSSAHEPELPSHRKGGAGFYSKAGGVDRQIAYLLGGWAMTDMLNQIYAPVTPEELARRAAEIARQRYVDLKTECTLTSLELDLLKVPPREAAKTWVPRLGRFSIDPTITAGQALVLCPHIKLLFTVHGLELPAFILNWFCTRNTIIGKTVNPATSQYITVTPQIVNYFSEKKTCTQRPVSSNREASRPPQKRLKTINTAGAQKFIDTVHIDSEPSSSYASARSSTSSSSSAPAVARKEGTLFSRALAAHYKNPR
jgi:hypothetical protein